jgi:hypothetical protein
MEKPLPQRIIPASLPVPPPNFIHTDTGTKVKTNTPTPSKVLVEDSNSETATEEVYNAADTESKDDTPNAEIPSEDANSKTAT